MIVTSENSMKIHNAMAANPPKANIVPLKPRHDDPYRKNGKNLVSIVRTGDRKRGIRKAVDMIGGVAPMIKDNKTSFLIKPNCNTDDPYPRDTHYNTIRTIAQMLIEAGIKPEKITIGDMSGKGRGLPTKATMENLGITQVADDLGLNISYFDEEDWIIVKPKKSKWWPNGLKIPKTVYNSERVIFTPILRTHSTSTFTCSLKLGVGLIDAEERDWLHNGENFYEKMMDINLAYQVDMVIADALKMNTGLRTDLKDEVSPGLITASNNMVASDAVSVALMQRYGTVRVVDYKTQDQIQFRLADDLGLGKPNLSNIELSHLNQTNDNSFYDLMEFIKLELK
jgi:uncharacterized protein (DUF362 family)